MSLQAWPWVHDQTIIASACLPGPSHLLRDFVPCAARLFSKVTNSVRSDCTLLAEQVRGDSDNVGRTQCDVHEQVIHGVRTMYNVRNGWDIARFLGDPLREDVEGHLANLQ